MLGTVLILSYDPRPTTLHAKRFTLNRYSRTMRNGGLINWYTYVFNHDHAVVLYSIVPVQPVHASVLYVGTFALHVFYRIEPVSYRVLRAISRAPDHGVSCHWYAAVTAKCKLFAMSDLSVTVPQS